MSPDSPRGASPSFRCPPAPGREPRRAPRQEGDSAARSTAFSLGHPIRVCSRPSASTPIQARNGCYVIGPSWVTASHPSRIAKAFRGVSGGSVRPSMQTGRRPNRKRVPERPGCRAGIGNTIPAHVSFPSESSPLQSRRGARIFSWHGIFVDGWLKYRHHCRDVVAKLRCCDLGVLLAARYAGDRLVMRPAPDRATVFRGALVAESAVYSSLLGLLGFAASQLRIRLAAGPGMSRGFASSATAMSSRSFLIGAQRLTHSTPHARSTLAGHGNRHRRLALAGDAAGRRSDFSMAASRRFGRGRPPRSRPSLAPQCRPMVSRIADRVTSSCRAVHRLGDRVPAFAERACWSRYSHRPARTEYGP